MKKLSLIAAAFFCTGIASASVIYDSILNPLPPNTVSQGYECCQVDELGRAVTFAGTERNLDTVSVVMSNWAYASQWTNLIGNNPDYTPTGFYLPMTLNLYVDNNGVEGALIATQTVNQFIAWRPEPSPNECAPGDNNRYLAGDGNCYNGSESIVNFDFLGLTVPDNLIYGIAYNTQTQGYNPTGVPGAYNSLNVGFSTAATVGSNTAEDIAFVNGAADSGWTGYSAQVQFNATSATPEPGTIGMMLGSLGVLGLVARRRKA